MNGRLRIAAVGLVVMTVLSALTSTAGASTAVTQWNVTGNGGFVSLNLLNLLQLTGGGSEADASSSPVAEAEGTGLCADTSMATNPCPTSATSSTSGNVVPNSTQQAVASGSGRTATPTGGGCTLPLNAGIINVDVSCGTASASEDASGNPTATGTGNLASVSVNLSLGSLLGLGSSASSLCSGVNAASTGGTSGTGPTGTLGTLLGTVNGVLGGLNLPILNGGSVDSSSTSNGACSLLGGLLNTVAGSGNTAGLGVLTSVLNQVLGLAGGNSVGIQPLTLKVGGSSTSVATVGNTVTDTVTQQSVDLNIFGLADLQVTPTTVGVSLDKGTGIVTPSCKAGVLSFSTASGLQQFLSLPPALTQALNNLLDQLSLSLDKLTSFLSQLIGDLIKYDPTGNLMNCDMSAPGASAHALVSTANVNGLLTGLMGGIGLFVGDVSASGSATTATPPATVTAAKTSPAAAPAAAPATAPAVVPNVTSVHTGEFWSGPLPIILLVGMGLAGALLIGRRRILSVARSINPITRRRSGQ
jgi:hypothetical protein